MEGTSVSGQHFKSKVTKLVDAEADRDKLYKCLRDYQLNHDIASFVNSLKSVVIHPDRLALFDEVRSFVQPAQQTLFNQLIPLLPSKKMRSIRLVRQGGENLGFALRGGVEFGVGALVSEVVTESLAARKGLKVGDEIVRVNGYNISQATHNEVISVLSSSKTLMLKVRNIGMLPLKTATSDPVTWKLISEKQPSFQVDSGMETDQEMQTDRKVFVNLQSGKKLGCGIGSGQNNEPGIFILKINPGSLAETLNFKIGDQILDVNGTSFLHISHGAAVMELKSSSQLTMTLRSKKEQVKDETILPIEKSTKLLVGADVSPIPKQLSEMGEKQSDEPTKDVAETADNVDSGKSRLSSNWSFKSNQKPEKYSQSGEDDGESKPSTESLRRGQPEAWWNKDPYSLFTHRQIDGRKICKIEIKKDMPLEILIEGGIESPLAGRVIVSEIYKDGAADRSGKLFKGDQLMMVDGKNMIDISLTAAQDILKEAMAKLDGTEVLRVITAICPVKNYEDELTFF